LRFEYTDTVSPDFLLLCGELDLSLNEQVGGEKNRSEYIQLNHLKDIKDVIIAYDNDIPVGCASFKQFDEECAEVKRVFLREDYRGMGISKKLMELIETYAKEKGFQYLIVETGKPMTTAINLYQGIGFQTIPNYGPYKDMEGSVCMKKQISLVYK
jgi:GNAT superfamily N-acetyltransferase